MSVNSTFETALECQQSANRARRILFQPIVEYGQQVLPSNLRHGRPQSYCDLDFQNISPLSTSGKFLLRRGSAVLTPEIFLEYWQQTSSPYLHRDIALMERKQRLATGMVKGMRELPYEDKLRRLHIFSLERRWLCGDLILAYNTFHGRLDSPWAEFFEAPSERDLRGHDFKLRHHNFAYSG